MDRNESVIAYMKGDDANLRSLQDAYAIMVPIPRNQLDPLRGIRDEVAFDAYVRQWIGDIRQSLPVSPLTGKTVAPDVSYYLVPPAAGPYRDFIFMIAENFNAIVQTVDSY